MPHGTGRGPTLSPCRLVLSFSFRHPSTSYLHSFFFPDSPPRLANRMARGGDGRSRPQAAAEVGAAGVLYQDHTRRQPVRLGLANLILAVGLPLLGYVE